MNSVKIASVNNYYFTSDLEIQCMGVTWYTSVDMQLFIFSPLFVYLLWWRKAWGVAALTAVTCASIGANFAVFSVFDIQPTTMFTRM